MKIILLGTLISDDTRDEFMKMGVSPQPANIAQKYILDGLNILQNAEEVYVIGSPRIEGFPECKIKRVKKEEFYIDGFPVKTAGYCNIVGLNYFSRKRSLIKECRKVAESVKDDDILVLCYSLNNTFLAGAKEIKRIHPKAKTAVIVADLPAFMSDRKGIISMAKKLDMKRLDKTRKKTVDKYVLYSKYMAEYLELPDEQWTVAEGFVNTDLFSPKEKKEKKDTGFICVYAGDLSRLYGIDKLIKAFRGIDGHIRLHLYGNPNDIAHYELNENVVFMGMKTPDELRKIYADADLLINPRPSALQLSKYSFPSKTFEYMASGTPVLMCRLPGIPDEYFEHCYCIEDETENGIREQVLKVSAMPSDELVEKGVQARMFITEEKGLLRQVNKMLMFCLDK